MNSYTIDKTSYYIAQLIVLFHDCSSSDSLLEFCLPFKTKALDSSCSQMTQSHHCHWLAKSKQAVLHDIVARVPHILVVKVHIRGHSHDYALVNAVHGGAAAVVAAGSRSGRRVAGHTYGEWHMDTHGDEGRAGVDARAWDLPFHAYACLRVGAYGHRDQPCDDAASCLRRPHHQHLL